MRYVAIAILIGILMLSSFICIAEANVLLIIKVVDIYGNPVSGVYITIVAPPPGSYIIKSGYTDKDGLLTVEMVNPPDEVTIFAAWRDVVVYSSKVSSYAGSATLECKIGNLSFHILSKSGYPVVHSRVIVSWMASVGIKSLEGYTDRSGYIVFKRMPLIPMNLSIYFKDRLLYFTRIHSLDVARNGLTIYLPLYNLKIDVLDAYNIPIEGALVTLSYKGGVLNRYSNSSGEVLFKYLSPGIYRLGVSYLGLEKSESVNLTSDMELSIVFESLKNYTLNVKVVDENGNVLPGCRVKIEGVGNEIHLTGYTDNRGIYSSNIPMGVYHISVYYGGITLTRDINLNSNQNIKFVIKYKPIGAPSGGNINLSGAYNYLILLGLTILILLIFILAFHFTLSKRVG